MLALRRLLARGQRCGLVGPGGGASHRFRLWRRPLRCLRRFFVPGMGLALRLAAKRSLDYLETARLIERIAISVAEPVARDVDFDGLIINAAYDAHAVAGEV